MAVRIGSARSSYGNTAPGDQNGGREVSREKYYVHSKGWYVIRAKNQAAREKIAVAMEHACDNNDIGYSQPTRLMLFNDVKASGCDLAFSFTVEVTGSLLETDGSFWCVSPTAKYYNVTPDESGRVSVTIPYSELYYDKDKRNFMELRLAGRSVVLSNLQVECGSSETEYEAPTVSVETLTVENNQPEFAQYVGSNCIMANRDNTAFELIELYGVL